MTVNEIAMWIAPAATMIAACMTAANLGSRVTGWGFVIFTVGSIAWSAVGLSSGQQGLLITNGFLTLVNAIGVWRWLGRQAKFEEGSERASDASAWQDVPTLFSAGGLIGKAVVTRSGNTLGQVVDAMMHCQGSAISYVVVTDAENGGLTEHLRAVEPEMLEFGSDEITYLKDRADFCARTELEKDKWPAFA